MARIGFVKGVECTNCKLMRFQEDRERRRLAPLLPLPIEDGEGCEELPEDYVCEHLRPEFWEAKGFERNWGDAAVMNWPHLEILRKGPPKETVYVVLAPYAHGRPVILNEGWGIY